MGRLPALPECPLLPAHGPDVETPAMVRPYVLDEAHRFRRRRARAAQQADQTRLGVAVLLDLATTYGRAA